MGNSRRLRIYRLVSLALIAAGSALMVGAFVPVVVTKTAIIPATQQGDVVLAEISLWFRGEISGTFSSNGAPLGPDGHYVHWEISISGDRILVLAEFGNNLSFPHREIPTSETYYISASCPYTVPDVEFSVEIHYKVSGLNLKFLVPGMVVLGGGIAVVSIVHWRKRKGSSSGLNPC